MMGSENILNGRTGERMQSLVFMDPTFYQRLIHMSEDKVKFHNTEPVQPLTSLQPAADRKGLVELNLEKWRVIASSPMG
jgi:DNA-directed RNA polymerase II subunit RPB2/DNA-directed RNA polymerase-4/5 subunit 2